MFKNDESAAGYLSSATYTPKRIFKKFPPTRIGIAGIDPIRDNTIAIFRSLVKAGVDIKGKLYKHFSHGYLSMCAYPFNLDD